MTRSLAGGTLAAILTGKAAVVIGPGIGATEAAAARVHEVLASGIPAVLDADALNVLAADPASIARAAGSIVLTPNPGEAVADKHHLRRLRATRGRFLDRFDTAF